MAAWTIRYIATYFRVPIAPPTQDVPKSGIQPQSSPCRDGVKSKQSPERPRYGNWPPESAESYRLVTGLFPVIFSSSFCPSSADTPDGTPGGKPNALQPSFMHAPPNIANRAYPLLVGDYFGKYIGGYISASPKCRLRLRLRSAPKLPRR
jgi:hypothetical protein